MWDLNLALEMVVNRGLELGACIATRLRYVPCYREIIGYMLFVKRTPP